MRKSKEQPERKPYTFYLDSDLATGLKAIKERDGISESEQIRRAIRQWLDARSEPPQARRAARSIR